MSDELRVMGYELTNHFGSGATHHGFTLLELLVVIFIVSLFLAVSVPSFTGMESNEMKSEAKRIASILRYLNDTAMAKKETMNLTVDFEDNSFTYTTEEGEKKEGVKYLMSLFLETKGEIRSGKVKITFTPLGAGEFMMFYLSETNSSLINHNSSPITVELNPLSGRVKIGEGVNG